MTYKQISETLAYNEMCEVWYGLVMYIKYMKYKVRDSPMYRMHAK